MTAEFVATEADISGNLDACKNQGIVAWGCGMTPDSNPYPPNTGECDSWAFGWNMANESRWGQK